MSKEVAKVEEQEAALALFEGANTGLEDLDTGAKPPARYLKIAQATTKALKKSNPDYLEGLGQGEFYNPDDRIIFGESVELVVIGHGRFYVEYTPAEAGELGEFVSIHSASDVEQGLVEGSERITVENRDGKEYQKWAMENGNELRATHNILVAAVKDDQVHGPYVLTLSKTNYYPAGQWMNLVKSALLPSGKPAPINSIVWRLGVSVRSNDINEWYAIGDRKPNVQRSRFVTPQEWAMVSAMRKEFEAMQASGGLQYADASDEAPSEKAEETEF